MSLLNRIAKEWLAAREVIWQCLAEWDVRNPQAKAEAIIGRLANHEPPILLEIDSGDDTNDLGAVLDELRSILAILDGLASQWGDEGLFRTARDRLRKVVGDATDRS